MTTTSLLGTVLEGTSRAVPVDNRCESHDSYYHMTDRAAAAGWAVPYTLRKLRWYRSPGYVHIKYFFPEYRLHR